MEVETFLVASALDGIVAQRLARKLCDRCKEPYQPTQPELHEAGYPEHMWPEIHELYRPVGCTACAQTGYLGRLGLYEVMTVTEEIERLAVERSSSDRMRQVALEQGMIPLRMDGLLKASKGQTSIQEILRVVV
jgi:type IV pilus assembly protein PilB